MSNIKQRAELALLISLPETIKGITKPGRLRNKVSEIAKEAQKEYNQRFYKATASERLSVDVGIERFDSRIKWTERPRHILTYVSAISVFIESRGYTKINKLIIEIIDYYERVGKAPAACFWAAVDAEKLWNESFKNLGERRAA